VVPLLAIDRRRYPTRLEVKAWVNARAQQPGPCGPEPVFSAVGGRSDRTSPGQLQSDLGPELIRRVDGLPLQRLQNDARFCATP